MITGWHFSFLSSQVGCDDADLSDAEKVYAECGQQQPMAWEECILPHRMKQCVKIGEGTFGEVFSTTNAAGDTVALKVRVFVYISHHKCSSVRNASGRLHINRQFF